MEIKRFFGWLRLLTCHPLTWLGSFMTTFGAVFTILYLISAHTRQDENTYLSILFVMVAPPMFIGGLLLIPCGVLLHVKHLRRHQTEFKGLSLLNMVAKAGQAYSWKATAAVILGLTGINVILTLAILYASYEFMESPNFCGTTCHVMAPQYSAYQRGSHAQVACVSCHVGAGLEHFVAAKINGTRQLWHILHGTYQRPIPTPVEHLRPARETCEKCHWPDHFYGEKLVVGERFEADMQNSKYYHALLFRIGDKRSRTDKLLDVHWHVRKGNRITYAATDKKRENIVWMRAEHEDGKVREFYAVNSKLSDAEIHKLAKREMDCLDCHNRPAHAFGTPNSVLDNAITATPMLQTLPYFKRNALAVLKKSYNREQINSGAVANDFRKSYQKRNDGPGTSAKLVETAARTVEQLYRENIFPEMRIDWNTYPQHQSHIDFPGCFRCHENTHRAKDGMKIVSDCRSCHTVLALKERNLEVIKKWR